MDTVGTRRGRELPVDRHTRQRWLWPAIGAALLVAAAGGLLVRRPAFLVRFLEPRYSVVEIRSAERTLLVQRANHVYLLQCGNDCDEFRVGSSYDMEVAGDHVRCHNGGRDLSLPIVEEQVIFINPGGRG
jgi:hypothetical protein